MFLLWLVEAFKSKVSAPPRYQELEIGCLPIYNHFPLLGYVSHDSQVVELLPHFRLGEYGFSPAIELNMYASFAHEVDGVERHLHACCP